MSGNLQLFWQLASASKQDRLSSSDKLITDLLDQQGALASSSKVTIESTEEADPNVKQLDEALGVTGSTDPLLVPDEAAQLAEELIGNRNAADLSYALKRLIRGLASPRENSRLGFAVALTELLSKLESLRSQEILALILKYSTPQGSVSGQEQRDLMFAKLFGVLALVQSGLLFRPTSSLSNFERAINVLLALAEKKSWMGESSGWVIFQSIGHLHGDKAPAWGDEALRWLARTIGSAQDKTPERVAILFKLEQTGRLDEQDHLFVPPFKNAQLLSSANLPILARILRDASASETHEPGTAARPGFRPQLHFVWDVILDSYFDAEASASPVQRSAASFPDFFKAVVDDSLFAASSSTERKSWGFQVFERALIRASDSDKPLLFTPNFMRTWINQLAGHDRFLHKAALKVAATVQDVVSANPKIGFSLVSQLIGEHGHQNFDAITKTKTVSGVLSSLDTEGVREYTFHLRDLICKAPDAADNADGAKGVASQRKWALDQVLSIVRNTAVPKDDTCIQSILELLIAHGYFAMKQPYKKGALLSVLPEVKLTDEFRQLCRSRLLSCLSELSSQTTVLSDSDGKTRKAQGVNSKGELWLSLAYDSMLRFDKETKTFASVFDRDEEIEARLKEGRACLDKIRKKENAAKEATVKDQLRAFQVLLLAGLIVSVDAEDGAADLVEPLCDCAGILFFASAKKPKKAAASDEAEGIEVLVDCLVNFLELPSAFLRFIATHAFEPFAKDMTADSLDHLFAQIGLGQSAEDDMDMDGEADGEADAADGGDGEAAEEASDTSATSDDEDDEVAESEAEDDEDEATDVDPELRAKIQAVLREGGIAESDAEGDEDESMQDDDGDSDSSVEFSDLDDDQMMLLDDKLAEVFRQQRSAKSSKDSKKEAKREEAAFKNKILDILEVYARRQSADALVLRLVSPLFNLARDEESDEKQLSNRAAGILRARICKAKEVPSGVSAADVAEDLEELHGVVRSVSKSSVTDLAAAIIYYLTKVALAGRTALSATEDAVVLKAYKATLTDFLTRRKSHVKPAFLVESFKRFPQLGWALREDILDSCRPGAAAHAFRQLTAMQMLQETMTQLAHMANKESILTFVPQISQSIGEIVTSAAIEAESPYNASRLKDTIKFALHMARLSKRLAPSEDKLKAAWKPVKLREATDLLKTCERFKASASIHAMVKQLFAILEGAGPNKAATPAKNEKKRRNPSDESAAANTTTTTTTDPAATAATSQSKPGSAKKAKAAKRA
ncbi:DNA-directed DNA polymerase [Thecaphora frezii]